MRSPIKLSVENYTLSKTNGYLITELIGISIHGIDKLCNMYFLW